MRQRDPERIIKLYNWLWRRAVDGKYPSFYQLSPSTLTGRCIWQLIPQMVHIFTVQKSRAYRDAGSKFIHSN